MTAKQKVALVTGGTAGVGLSVVRALVTSGAFVHFIGTNERKGARIERELNATFRARLSLHQARPEPATRSAVVLPPIRE